MFTISACAFDPAGSEGNAVANKCIGVDGDTVALYRFDNIADLARDETGNHHGKVNGEPPSVVSGPCGSAIQFPDSAASDPFIEIPNSPDWDMEEGAIDFWLRTDAAGLGLLSRDAVQQLEPGHFTIGIADDRRIVVRVQDGVDHIVRCSTLPIAEAEWTHIAVNIGPPAVELYIDGELGLYQGQTTWPGNAGLTYQCGSSAGMGIAGNSNPWVLGASAANSEDGAATPTRAHLLGGAIDHLRISSRRRGFSTGNN